MSQEPTLTYSKHAEVTVPSLDDWEKQWNRQTVDGGQESGTSVRCSVVGGQDPEGIVPRPKVVQVDFGVLADRQYAGG